MATKTVTIYGPGGFDPAAPGSNVVEQYEVEVPDEAPVASVEELRTALTAASTMSQIKAVLGAMLDAMEAG